MAGVLSFAIQQRLRIVLEPAPHAIVASDAVVVAPSLLGLHGRKIVGHIGLGVVRMDQRVPPLPTDLFRRLAGELKKMIVDEQVLAFGVIAPDQRRRRIRKRAELRLALAQSSLEFLACSDVGEEDRNAVAVPVQSKDVQVEGAAERALGFLGVRFWVDARCSIRLSTLNARQMGEPGHRRSAAWAVVRVRKGPRRAGDREPNRAAWDAGSPAFYLT